MENVNTDSVKQSCASSSAVADRSARLQNIQTATVIVSELDGLNWIQVRNVLGLVALSYGQKMVPQNAVVAIPLKEQSKSNVHDKPPKNDRSKGAAKKLNSRPANAGAGQPASFNKFDQEWVRLNEEMDDLGVKIRGLKKDGEEHKAASAERKALGASLKLLKNKLQKLQAGEPEQVL